MRKPLTIGQLRNAVEIRKAKVQGSVTAFQGSDNPQVRDMYLKASGELEALTGVLEAIEQKTVYFLEN
jgi:hypothetical protein